MIENGGKLSAGFQKWAILSINRWNKKGRLTEGVKII
jgi:hypothetical protein